MKDYWDSLYCEEYDDYRKGLDLDSEEDLDWMDANVEGVTLDGEPLDGHYFDRLIEGIPF